MGACTCVRARVCVRVCVCAVLVCGVVSLSVCMRVSVYVSRVPRARARADGRVYVCV